MDDMDGRSSNMADITNSRIVKRNYNPTRVRPKFYKNLGLIMSNHMDVSKNT